MKAPKATYRLQLNKDFTFDQLNSIVSYLSDLGIDTIYASPIFKAVADSNHGYDGVDMHTINPEIGSLEQLIDIKQKLSDRQMHWLQDIVPNHMAFHHANAWLMDLLEYGSASSYRDYFDSSLSAEWFSQEQLMVPVLGNDLDEVIDNNEIIIAVHNNKLYFQYFDQHWPLSAESAQELLTEFTKKIALSSSAEESLTSPQFSNFLAKISASHNKLRKLLNKQHYRLCHWQETDTNINFRRFFTVNGLICLQINKEEVFQDAHRFVAQLLQQNIIDGLRIDHIDGIYNPTQYLMDLRRLAGEDTYIVAEKILEHAENLPDNWPIAGTTGYEFLAAANNVLIDATGEKAFTKIYEKYVGKQLSLKRQQRNKKAAILTKHMQGEMDQLADLFIRLQLADNEKAPKATNLAKVICSFLVLFPTYRSYATSFPCAESEFQIIDAVYRKLKKNNPETPLEVQLFWAACRRAQLGNDAAYAARFSRFFTRCMQFAGPAMAKGVEDTLMYTYNRFLGTNEVGDHPANFGIAIEDFHAGMVNRQRSWPKALNTTATHDTKRGEDARARLQVLTACPEIWAKTVKKWHKQIKDQYQHTLPHPNDQYAIFQAIFASYPILDEEENFEDRLLAYITKYLREGKEHSDWAQPDEQYENNTKAFARFLLTEGSDFQTTLRKLHAQLNDFAIVNSLCQVMLKFTSPGIPDTYQGTELWDFSFVDPDNRRAVDFALRSQYLADINRIAPNERPSTLWKERSNGKIKLWLTQQLAKLRKHAGSLSENASYLPLTVTGKYEAHILAFARQHRDSWTIVVLPVHLARIDKLHKCALPDFDWDDTCVILPTTEKVSWTDCLGARQGEGNVLFINDLFTDIPLALVQYESQPNKRRAGILMSISSLPSDFGIGDLGKPARDFAQALYNAGQKYWQVLPLGPLSKEQFYSPYSTLSAMAGNPLLISLESLATAGFLDVKELENAQLPLSNSIAYDEVVRIKTQYLHQAFKRASIDQDANFIDFCTKESSWLQDYSLFMALRKAHGEQPWYMWPAAFKHRDPAQLAAFTTAHIDDIRFEQWIQYIFFKQWKELKEYCYHLHISFVGDIPIYVGHDAADVWANPELFSLDNEGHIQFMAGVPPDYFNAQGQQWGMPVFNWANHKKQNFTWWLRRIKQNLALYDLVRLDHFRAFVAYWQIPMPADNAIEGQWVKAAGLALFKQIKANFPDMPFIAEDLGDIDASVYELRDEYKLAGMKVLQFAFGDDMPHSTHVPHHYGNNFVVYTGTHDNNTTMGWFKDDLDSDSRKRLQFYLSSTVYAKNVADLLTRVAYASVAETVIVPMQDVLSLGKKNRMNTPSSTAGNWTWRMLPTAFSQHVQERLKSYATGYDRL